MNSKALVRQSSVIDLPEQFVTVEIHNNSTKKKFRNHRESIINQMKNTEDLLEETLNRNVRHPRSKFMPLLTASPTPLPTSTSTPRLTHGLTSSRTANINVGGQVTRKLNQLCTISQHFDRACEYRQRLIPTVQGTPELSYSLPVATPPPILSTADRKAREEMAEHKNMVRDWEAKAKQGREFVKRAKLKHPLRFRDLNKAAQNVQKRSGLRRGSSKPSLRSLRDIYFSELRAQRKTAPPGSNNLELLFLQQREKVRGGIGYVGAVENQPVLQLQRFIEGGEQRSFNQFSDWLNLGQFRRSKEKFKMLQKLYNHVRQNNLYQFKDMNPDRLNQQTLLAIVYYLENSPNMTEGERRLLRKRLKVID